MEKLLIFIAVLVIGALAFIRINLVVSNWLTVIAILFIAIEVVRYNKK